MSIPAPNVEYAQLSPMLIVFGVAVSGILVEALVPRQNRFRTQLILCGGGLITALLAVILLTAGTTAALSWAPSWSTAPRCSSRARYC